MKQLLILVIAVGLLVAAQAGKKPNLTFSRYFVAAESYESVGAFDVNNDGRPDLVSGDFWYENNGQRAGNFRKRHLIGSQSRQGEYYDDFSTIPLDVNGDGFLDVVTGGWWGGALRWLENPGANLAANKPWPIHPIDTTGSIETTCAWDVDGDGKPEIVPNNPGKALKYVRVERGQFTVVTVWPKHGHGLGCGDIDRDGKTDFIVSEGWLKRTADTTWSLQPEFKLGSASVPILVADVNQDGQNDLVVGQAHAYGLHWYEQQRQPNGLRTWQKHTIDSTASQYHVMQWADLDRDGQPELVTGKRFRAHNDGDPGADDPVGLYYFTVNKGQFQKHAIAHGPAGVGKGTGIQFALSDLLGRGRTDIIVAGKE
jgi:hypothetical protein